MANNKCALSSVPYEDLTYCYGKPVLSGIKPSVYAIPAKWLWGSFPAVNEVSPAKRQSELAIIDKEPELRSGRRWLKLDLVPTKGGITWETQGERPARTFLNKATFIFPGTCEEAAAFARQAVHDFLIYAVQQTDGAWRILGSAAFPTDTKVSGETGEGVTGEMGTKIEVEAVDVCPAPFYKNKLYVEDGHIIHCGQPLAHQYMRNLIHNTNGAFLESLKGTAIKSVVYRDGVLEIDGVGVNNELTTQAEVFKIDIPAIKPFEQVWVSCKMECSRSVNAFVKAKAVFYDEANVKVAEAELTDGGQTTEGIVAVGTLYAETPPTFTKTGKMRVAISILDAFPDAKYRLWDISVNITTNAIYGS